MEHVFPKDIFIEHTKHAKDDFELKSVSSEDLMVGNLSDKSQNITSEIVHPNTEFELDTAQVKSSEPLQLQSIEKFNEGLLQNSKNDYDSGSVAPKVHKRHQVDFF
jgi:hypothetical protein